MHLSKRQWLGVSGLIWMGIGMMLLVKGLSLLITSVLPRTTAPVPLLLWSLSIVETQSRAVMFLISLSLFLGWMKGRMILGKTVRRVSMQIPEGKSTLSQVYDRKYYFVLAAMVGLGVVFRLAPIPIDCRGFIDVTIGSALVNGSLLYFQQMVPKRD